MIEVSRRIEVPRPFALKVCKPANAFIINLNYSIIGCRLKGKMTCLMKKL